jgi:hypothetical protein
LHPKRKDRAGAALMIGLTGFIITQMRMRGTSSGSSRR